MPTVNNFVKSLSGTPRNLPVIIMCPVEEIGKNSVSPSTMAIITASTMLMIIF
jgi:hypothetical protein